MSETINLLERDVYGLSQVDRLLGLKGGTAKRWIEGYTRGQWALIDYGDVVVHIFFEPVRAYYDLERLWGHAPRVALPELRTHQE